CVPGFSPSSPQEDLASRHDILTRRPNPSLQNLRHSKHPPPPCGKKRNRRNQPNTCCWGDDSSTDSATPQLRPPALGELFPRVAPSMSQADRRWRQVGLRASWHVSQTADSGYAWPSC